MKKTISMLLVCVLLLGTVFALSSCGLSGTYKNDLYTLEFSGDKVHITAKVSVGVTITSEYDATYKISDGENGKVITFTYADDADKSVILMVRSPTTKALTMTAATSRLAELSFIRNN